MRRPVSLPLYALIAVVVVSSFVPEMSLAQPAPNPCPEGEVLNLDSGECVPADEVPDPADDGGEGTGQPAPAGTIQEAIADLTLLHYACDAGFDPRAGTGDRNTACTGTSKPAFTYTITINGQVIASSPVQTGDGVRGRLDLDSTPARPIPAGDMVIAVQPIEGWTSSWIVCEIDNPIEGNRVVEPAIVGNAASVTLAVDDIAVCDWFNVATGGQDAGSAPPVVDVEESSGPGADITIATFNCPPGTTSANDVVSTCTERASGLTFSLVTATATVTTQGSDAEGDIFFEDVAAGDYGIAVDLPSGYGKPIVICYHASADGIVAEGQEDIVFGNQFRFTVLGDGEFLECAWYNLPAQGADSGPNVFIEAHSCTPGTSLAALDNVFEALALCPSFYGNLEFSVLNVDQVISTARTNQDPLSAGQVFFTRLPEPGSGAYAVTANVNEGERTLAVFCDQDFGDGTFQVIPIRVTGDRMDQELGMGAGDTLRCSWFVEGIPPVAQVPPASDTGEITGLTLLHYACDAGFDPQAGTGDRNVACTGAGKPEFTYTISIDGQVVSSMPLQTSDGTRGRGEVYSTPEEPLPAGTMQIALAPVADWTPTWVRCESDSAATGIRIVEPEIIDGAISLPVAADELVTCDWFNVETGGEGAQGDQAAVANDAPTLAVVPDEEPAAEDAAAGAGGDEPSAGESPAPGITVLARLCPAEVAGLDLEADLTADCAQPASGITLEILVDNESAGTFATDTNGELAVPSELGAGQYLFRLQPVPGLLELRTVCDSVYPEGATATGRSQVAGSDVGEIYLTNDGRSETTCSFFFIGGQFAGGQETGETADAPAMEDSPAAEAGEGDAVGDAPALTLSFLVCPEGTDPAADPSGLEQVCAVETVDRSFMLTRDGVTTGETIVGTATWGLQDLTAYVEIEPGTASVVRCTSTWVEGAEQVPAMSVLDGGLLTITLQQPDTVVSCNWFIFPD